MEPDPFEGHDPYARCEERCTHDLARGVTVADLLSGDGPYPPSHLVVNLGFRRDLLFPDEERLPAGERRRAAGA